MENRAHVQAKKGRQETTLQAIRHDIVTRLKREDAF